jgi:hypothetical protein
MVRGNGAKMSAVVSRSRARSTWLTGTAGLLMLVAAFVMMVVAAPRVHAARHETQPSDRLTSWVWTTPDHWVTPASNDQFARIGRAPIP